MTITVERRLRVARRQDDCFRYLADFSTCEQWDPGVARADKRTPGSVRVGSEFDLQLRVLGRRVPMHYELVAMAPAQRLLLRGEGEGFAVRDEIRFTALEDRVTEIHYRADMDLRAVPRAVRGMLRSWCERIGDAAMQGLERALVADAVIARGAEATLAERLLLPAATQFTRFGYAAMPTRGLSRFVDGRRIAITGATGGLGLAMAQLLARQGAQLLLIGRGRERLQAAVRAIEDFAGPTAIETFEAELSLIGECHRVAAALAARTSTLDVLINNAGVLPTQRIDTAEGHELALAVNLLAPYTLTRALLPQLQAAQGRVINVVSGGLYLQPLRLDDLQFSTRAYDGAKAYAQAKRALLVMTQRWAADRQHSALGYHAMHPGWAATPGVANSLPGFARAMGSLLRDARMGADTAVWLATHPALGGPQHRGGFWFDRQLRPDAVLPGTAVSAADGEALQRWLRKTCGL